MKSMKYNHVHVQYGPLYDFGLERFYKILLSEDLFIYIGTVNKGLCSWIQAFEEAVSGVTKVQTVTL